MAEHEDTSPLGRVLSFCGAWTGPDLDRALAYLASDVVYHNMPMAPLHGLPAVEAYLRGAGPISDSWWEVRHAAASGDVVLTERVDHMTIGRARIALSLMGVFRVRSGLICEWRDYFDLASYRQQLAGVGAGREGES